MYSQKDPYFLLHALISTLPLQVLFSGGHCSKILFEVFFEVIFPWAYQLPFTDSVFLRGYRVRRLCWVRRLHPWTQLTCIHFFFSRWYGPCDIHLWPQCRRRRRLPVPAQRDPARGNHKNSGRAMIDFCFLLQNFSQLPKADVFSLGLTVFHAVSWH